MRGRFPNDVIINQAQGAHGHGDEGNDHRGGQAAQGPGIGTEEVFHPNPTQGVVDKIKEEGFSGVYLDKVDEFEYWSEKGYDERTLASSMTELIGEISKRAGSMLVFIQNGERIVDLDPRILDYVDGIGIEDLWYDGTVRNDENYTSDRLKYIEKFKKRGKTVLVVDYVDDESGYSGENLKRIEDFISKAREEGFIPYAARSDRELDEIVVIRGIQPK